MKPQPLSDFHQQLQQSWAIAQFIPKEWRFQGQRKSKQIAIARIVPVAIAWSLRNSSFRRSRDAN